MQLADSLTCCVLVHYYFYVKTKNTKNVQWIFVTLSKNVCVCVASGLKLLIKNPASFSPDHLGKNPFSHKPRPQQFKLTEVRRACGGRTEAWTHCMTTQWIKCWSNDSSEVAATLEQLYNFYDCEEKIDQKELNLELRGGTQLHRLHLKITDDFKFVESLPELTSDCGLH